VHGEESYLMVKHIELVEMPLFFVVKFNLNLKKLSSFTKTKVFLLIIDNTSFIYFSKGFANNDD
jgi:hypothetical protein